MLSQTKDQPNASLTKSMASFTVLCRGLKRKRERFMVVFTILRSASSVRTPRDTLQEISEIYFKLDVFSGGKSRNGIIVGWAIRQPRLREIALEFCWQASLSHQRYTFMLIYFVFWWKKIFRSPNIIKLRDLTFVLTPCFLFVIQFLVI